MRILIKSGQSRKLVSTSVLTNSSGQVTDLKLGNSSNNFRKQSCFNANTLRLEALRAYTGSLLACGTNPSPPILNLKFTNQANGNISQAQAQ